jgi:hypothetical protein
MSPSIIEVRNELNNFLDYLLNSQIALMTTPVRRDDRVVTWQSEGGFSFQRRSAPSSIVEYRAWVEARSYSALLTDGALLQITYEFDGRNVVRHRLAYVPCPFDIDREMLRTDPPLDVIDLYAAGDSGDVLLRSAIRFDFDLSRSRAGHPASHLTVNSNTCRVACVGPLRLGHFVSFVFRHFYPELWLFHPYLGQLARRPLGQMTATEDDRSEVHVAWRA